ncbi:MAG TPA: hypothetical protein VGU64_20250, partial [Terriglobales bacterium]|nr:hypothetical protein [Terriglobales bacterium]
MHSKLITFGFLPALALVLTVSVIAANPTFAAEPPAPAAATAPPAAAVAASAQPTVPVPDDPLGRGTPRSSVEKFFVAAREGDFALAAKYLDLSGLAADAQASQGPKLARDLWFVLERQAKTDFSTLSIDPLGNLADGLPPNREQLERIEWPGGYADVDLERVRDMNGLEVWKVSSRSVEEIPQLYERFRMRVADLFLSKTTMDSILKSRVFGLSGVTWFIIGVCFCVWSILVFVLLMLARWVIPRMRPGVA